MNFSLYKRFLSYVSEIPVETVKSDFHNQLHVFLVKGRLQLSTDNAIYSFGDLYDNFNSTFHEIKWDKLAIKDVLLLGFGLGSIPFMLETKFKKDFRYTAVELDEAVTYLASKYVLDDLKSPITVITGDAYQHVMQSEEKYDMICMDVFVDDIIPNNLQSLRFLQKLETILNPNGIILYNRLSRTRHDRVKTLQFYEERFKTTFPGSDYLDTGGNWILINRSDVKSSG